MSRETPEEQLYKLMRESGLKIKFGLRAQGHIPTIDRMLAEGATWEEIGATIGWHPPTAKEWYERELNAAAKARKSG